MRIVFAGTPAVALPSFDALIASSHEVVAAITRPDAPAGRGRHQAVSPVASRAGETGVEVAKPRRPSEPEFLAWLERMAPDVVAVVAYGALVPTSALEIPKHGWINLHFSLLPAWRGAAPVNHAILRGDDITGASTFVLERGLDTGPVLGMLTEEIRPRDTAGELLDRLAVAGAGLLVATMDGVASGELRAVPQSSDGVSLAPKLTPDDARVDWHAPARHIDRLVRATTPSPGAWTTFRGRRLKLAPVVPLDAPATPDADAARSADGDRASPLAPGALRVIGARPTAVVAGTATTPVVVERVQPEGKAAMPALDWARGARLTDEDRFV